MGVAEPRPVRSLRARLREVASLRGPAPLDRPEAIPQGAWRVISTSEWSSESDHSTWESPSPGRFAVCAPACERQRHCEGPVRLDQPEAIPQARWSVCGRGLTRPTRRRCNPLVDGTLPKPRHELATSSLPLSRYTTPYISASPHTKCSTGHGHRASPDQKRCGTCAN